MTRPRKSTIFLFSLATLFLLSAAMFFHARLMREAESASIGEMAKMVRDNGLTDLCMFTEASYTRNPTQTDMQTPFREYPVSPEHFPSGSLMPPPLPQKESHAPSN